jgi:D,D-heptose 1,7-bisphosphate phosphatase
VDRSYVFRFADIVWVDGIVELIEFAKSAGLLVIVLTNQSGVAQGKYLEADVIKLHQEMNEYLKDKNALVDAWFYCTEYDSERRKPRPGMMIEARDLYAIDLEKSFMVGDKVSDILEVTGPKTLLLQGNYPLDEAIAHNKAEVFTSLLAIHNRLKELLKS